MHRINSFISFNCLGLSWSDPTPLAELHQSKYVFLLVEKLYLSLFLFFSVGFEFLSISFEYHFIVPENGDIYKIIVIAQSGIEREREREREREVYKIGGGFLEMLKVFIYVYPIERW